MYVNMLVDAMDTNKHLYMNFHVQTLVLAIKSFIISNTLLLIIKGF